MFKISTDHDLDFIGIVDDNFMVQPKRLAQLPDTVGKVGVNWGTHGRLDEAADAKRVEDMAAAGCKYIGFGAESASPKTLEAMGKGGQMLTRGESHLDGYNVPATMTDGAVNCDAVGVHPNTTWIMGYPGETLEDLKHTAAFIRWQRDWCGAANGAMFVATAYPGTEMFKHPTVQARLNIQDDRDLEAYVLKLGDATDVVGDESGPYNYSDMDNDTFLQAKAYADAGTPELILEM